MGYCSDSIFSAESRYSELVADEVGYEPDAELNNWELNFLDCHDWELIAPRGERRDREALNNCAEKATSEEEGATWTRQGQCLKKKKWHKKGTEEEKEE